MKEYFVIECVARTNESSKPTKPTNHQLNGIERKGKVFVVRFCNKFVYGIELFIIHNNNLSI